MWRSLFEQRLNRGQAWRSDVVTCCLRGQIHISKSGCQPTLCRGGRRGRHFAGFYWLKAFRFIGLPIRHPIIGADILNLAGFPICP